MKAITTPVGFTAYRNGAFDSSPSSPASRAIVASIFPDPPASPTSEAASEAVTASSGEELRPATIIDVVNTMDPQAMEALATVITGAVTAGLSSFFAAGAANTSPTSAAAAPVDDPAAPSSSTQAGGLAALQASALAATSGAASADPNLSSINNGNIESSVRGVTASARSILAGGAAAVSSSAVASAALPGGWLAFLKFDRHVRAAQFYSGVAWDQALDQFEFFKVLMLLMMAAPKAPALALPSTSTPKSGAGSSRKASAPKSGQCFDFWHKGECPRGANCPYRDHHCTICGPDAKSHGTGQCNAGPGKA